MSLYTGSPSTVRLTWLVTTLPLESTTTKKAALGSARASGARTITKKK